MKNVRSIFQIIFLFFSTSVIFSQHSVTMRISFVDSLKNSVSIKGLFTVDAAKTHTAIEDADMHIAGRNLQIGLPLVAELMNARSCPEALAVIKSVKGSDEPIDMYGVWRLWFEHPKGHQKQKSITKKFTSTNPDHVFEIHPVLSVNEVDVLSSLKPIKGYKTKDAEKSFKLYLKKLCKISRSDKLIKIESNKAAYNYVKFKITLVGKVKKLGDGSIVEADVYTLKDKLLAEKIMMVFPKDSEPEIELRKLKLGDSMTVLGMPRVSLSEISKKLEEDAGPIEINLPFEMVIVGLY